MAAEDAFWFHAPSSYISPKNLLAKDSMLIAVNKLLQSCECKILKVIHSNGSKPKAFTFASCDVEVYPMTYSFHTLFQKTLKKLIHFHRNADLQELSKRKKLLSEDRERLDEKDDVKMSEDDKLILDKLLSMFDQNKVVADKLRQNLESKHKSIYAVQLAHHLLKPLSKFEIYKMDHQTKNQPEECVCCKEPMPGGVYKDTSIGHEMVWHGTTDILIADEVNITICEEELETGKNIPTSTFDANTSFDINRDAELQSYREQIIAKTVVFSFLQNKEKLSTSGTLIPTIAISKREVLICFYDSEHDILLQSDPLKLFYKDGFNPHTLLALWLVINYRITCSGLTSGIVETNFTSDFLKYFTEDIRYKYRNELRFRNCSSSQELEEDTFVLSSNDHSKPLQGGLCLEDEDIKYALNKCKEIILG